MLAEFPVRRPIVSMVISILIVIMGVVAYPTLPIAQYPDITPPVVQVTTTYPGASAQVVADTVASPIEQQVNGVPGMIYMESTSASDGSYTLKVTFELGTDIDIASVLVQNRVSIATPKLPDEVKRQGVTTDRVSSNVITVFALAPKDAEAAKKYDDLFIANYLTINILDEIKRISGVGDAKIFPAKDYGIRFWLNPDQLKARDLTTMDVINALKAQNVQVAAGAIGQPPAPAGQAYQYNVSTLGRLTSVEQFENVIIRADGNRIIRAKDVALVELGGKSYDLLARYLGTPAAAMVVYQAPGGNAVQVAKDVKKLLHDKTATLPEGLSFEIVYDTSEFVLSAIEGVYHTFFEALALVLAVVIIFLGSLRLSLIPMLAIPVSIIGSFFFAKMLGFSINMPVLFGLVVAIGIVVDDAIVVVENVERVMNESHLPPKEATVRAMKEVLAPVMSITVVLMAVFVPTAFLPGISGQLFRQFALTIAASTFLSGLCAVTLTPALCGVILRAHKEGHKPFILVRWFNQGFDALANGYARLVKFLVHPAVVLFTLGGFGACVFAIVWTFGQVPTGFVPLEDRGMVMIDLWMPDACSQERTLAAVQKVETILSKTDGVRNYTSLPGFSMINNNGSNYALFFIGLEDWDVRLPKGRDLATIMADLRKQTAQIPDGLCIVFSLPAVDGVGNASGFDLRLQDRTGIGREAMGQLVQGLVVDGNAQSRLAGVNSAYRAAVPQLFADVDREKVMKLGIPLQDVFSTMSGYLAAAYVNDFNLYGRTWQVNVSAAARFRATPRDITQLDVRKPDGSMVPLGSLLNVRESMGADRVIRYNLFPAAVLQGQAAPGVSSGEALDVVESMADAKLPTGTTYEWTALSFQEKLVGNQAVVVFAMALLVVYLILAALYESWFIPLSVILSIPLAVLGAMAGLMWRGMDNNIYTQVGLVLLAGLGAKNAILIVEFAKAYREQGKGIVESAVEASRQRLRPILMTAFAFILGVLPLVLATGAGAASRQAIGTAVFFGMIGNTFLGLVFTPVLYVVIQATTEKTFGRKTHVPAESPEPAPAHAHQMTEPVSDEVTLLGASGGEVTGSAYVLQADRANVMIDCGLFQGARKVENYNRLPKRGPLQTLDAVVLTHAHLDHTGRLPILTRFGYSGPIYATPATIDLTDLSLRDSAHLQSEDAKRESRRRKTPIEPLYKARQVEQLRPLFRRMRYDHPTNVAPGITVRAVEAGHVLGSASLEFTVQENGRKKVVVFSGDLGPRGAPLHHDPTPFKHADLVFMESTYGDHDHPSLQQTAVEAREAVRAAVERKGRVLVPVFAIGRTQLLLFLLAGAFKRKTLKPFPIFVDSPMAIEATTIYKKHMELFDEEAAGMVRSGELSKNLSTVKALPKAADSRALATRPGPFLVMAGAGMCTGGRILHHLLNHLPDPTTLLLMVGYQSHGSIGRAIADGAKSVRILGKKVPVRATTHTFGGLSGHAGQSDLLAWIGSLAPSRPRVILTHGEDGPRRVLRDLIQKRFRLKAELPDYLETIEC